MKKETPKEKSKNPVFTGKVEVDIEPNLDKHLDEATQELVLEVMNVASRMRRKQQIRRYKAKMKIARTRSMRRRASQQTIQKRARRSAIAGVKRRLSSGRSTKSLSYSERSRVEKLAQRRKSVINRNAKRMVMQKRSTERKRLARR